MEVTIKGSPEEVAALVLELLNPQIEISDDAIVRTTTRFCGFDPPLGGGDHAN